MKPRSLHDQLTTRIRALASRELRPQHPPGATHESYTYGIYAEPLRRLLREYRPTFLALTMDERLALAEQLYGSRIEEYAAAATYVLSLCSRELAPAHLESLDRMLEHLTSWSAVDDFCVNVLSPLALKYPRPVVRMCLRWSKSPNPWKRRASIVTFTRRVGASGRFTRDVLLLCDNLVWDRDHLVQKGVGWALKDNLRSAPEQVVEYVKRLRRQGVSANITLYAIREVSGRVRQEILATRREEMTVSPRFPRKS